MVFTTEKISVTELAVEILIFNYTGNPGLPVFNFPHRGIFKTGGTTKPGNFNRDFPFFYLLDTNSFGTHANRILNWDA
jgi:hypothetical protein